MTPHKTGRGCHGAAAGSGRSARRLRSGSFRAFARRDRWAIRPGRPRIASPGGDRLPGGIAKPGIYFRSGNPARDNLARRQASAPAGSSNVSPCQCRTLALAGRLGKAARASSVPGDREPADFMFGILKNTCAQCAGDQLRAEANADDPFAPARADRMNSLSGFNQGQSRY